MERYYYNVHSSLNNDQRNVCARVSPNDERKCGIKTLRIKMKSRINEFSIIEPYFSPKCKSYESFIAVHKVSNRKFLLTKYNLEILVSYGHKFVERLLFLCQNYRMFRCEGVFFQGHLSTLDVIKTNVIGKFLKVFYVVEPLPMTTLADYSAKSNVNREFLMKSLPNLINTLCSLHSVSFPYLNLSPYSIIVDEMLWLRPPPLISHASSKSIFPPPPRLNRLSFRSVNEYRFYRPPEWGLFELSCTSDTWSLATILAEFILFGGPLFGSLHNIDYMKRVQMVLGAAPLSYNWIPIDNTIPFDFPSPIKAMLNYDPKKRPSLCLHLGHKLMKWVKEENNCFIGFLQINSSENTISNNMNDAPLTSNNEEEFGLPKARVFPKPIEDIRSQYIASSPKDSPKTNNMHHDKELKTKIINNDEKPINIEATNSKQVYDNSELKEGKNKCPKKHLQSENSNISQKGSPKSRSVKKESEGNITIESRIIDTTNPQRTSISQIDNNQSNLRINDTNKYLSTKDLGNSNSNKHFKESKDSGEPNQKSYELIDPIQQSGSSNHIATISLIKSDSNLPKYNTLQTKENKNSSYSYQTTEKEVINHDEEEAFGEEEMDLGQKSISIGLGSQIIDDKVRENDQQGRNDESNFNCEEDTFTTGMISLSTSGILSNKREQLPDDISDGMSNNITPSSLSYTSGDAQKDIEKRNDMTKTPSVSPVLSYSSNGQLKPSSSGGSKSSSDSLEPTLNNIVSLKAQLDKIDKYLLNGLKEDESIPSSNNNE